jgi:hypothetical protein
MTWLNRKAEKSSDVRIMDVVITCSITVTLPMTTDVQLAPDSIERLCDELRKRCEKLDKQCDVSYEFTVRD